MYILYTLARISLYRSSDLGTPTSWVLVINVAVVIKIFSPSCHLPTVSVHKMVKYQSYC